jgi:uncharacterized protein YcbX
MPVTVATLSIAPVKGLGLQHPHEVRVAAHGVVGDRRYAMVDEHGRLANGKKFGPLVRVAATFDDDPERLVLHLPDGTQIGGEVSLGEPCEAVFYGSPRAGRLVEGGYAEALSELAGEQVRLMRMPDGEGIDRPEEGAVSLQSVGGLESLAQAGGLDHALDGRRFRMTFTLDGVEPYAEDSWMGRRVRLGDTVVVVPEGNIGRCVVTTYDPDSGVKSFDTLKVLASTRGHLPSTEPLPFGVHARVLRGGVVRVGDPVSLED